MPTKIEWAEETWNPITGCTPVSEGCANCYAKRMATRLRGRCGYPADDPFRVTFHPERLDEPLKWKKPRIIFVCSMGDMFHEDVPDKWRNLVFQRMAMCPQHKFLLLTKRPKNMSHYWLSEIPIPRHPQGWVIKAPGAPRTKIFDHIWLGVSAENQQRANERIPVLLDIPGAAVRFVSVEPMLGPVDLSGPLYAEGRAGQPGTARFDATKMWMPRLDWVICGGESGPGARPMYPDWPRALRDQCQAAGVPFFFKQWGKYCYPEQMPEDTYNAVDVHHNLAGHGDYNKPWGVGKKLAGRLLDDEKWNEMPAAEE